MEWLSFYQLNKAFNMSILILTFLPDVKCTCPCFLLHHRSYSIRLRFAPLGEHRPPSARKPSPHPKHLPPAPRPSSACTHAHRHLGALGVRQGLGQLLHVCPTRAHLRVRIGASEVGVAAPGRAQDSPRFWNVGVPCWGVGRAKGKEDKKWLDTEDTPEQATASPRPGRHGRRSRKDGCWVLQLFTPAAPPCGHPRQNSSSLRGPNFPV